MKKIMVTGHRPPKIGGYDRYNDTRIWLRQTMLHYINRIYSKYPGSQFLSGMALGTDQDFAEVVINNGYELVAVCPAKWQPNNWPIPSRTYYYSLLHDCVEIQYVSDEIHADRDKVREVLMQRNTALVDQSDAAIVVWDGSQSGTMDAINKINDKEIKWLWIKPNERATCWMFKGQPLEQ